jgi:N utilization substance protein B|tara:strand:- start:6292 stop:7200 length:909 start_codon:yes stop_codon:yes gene_type:complete
MEVVYAYEKSIEKNIDFQLNYFLNSNKKFYHLYITILSIFRSIYVHSIQCNDQNSKKFLKDETNLFYLKFSKNTFLKKLSFDKVLENKIVEFKIDIFEKHPEYLISLWKKIEESKLFSDYINNKNHSFEKDKFFTVNLFKKIIALDDKLYEFFEDTEISWINDLPLVNSLVLNTFKKIQKRSRKSPLLIKLYKNDEDAEFGVKLIKDIIFNNDMLMVEIDKATSNWDNERIAQIDLILLKMCLTEFLFFNSIPVKVSINEYLELAKEYSSPKSNIFINGIMDTISKQLIKNGRIKKNKRGLQ